MFSQTKCCVNLRQRLEANKSSEESSERIDGNFLKGVSHEMIYFEISVAIFIFEFQLLRQLEYFLLVADLKLRFRVDAKV